MKIKKLFLFVIISFVLFNVNAQQGNEVVVLDREIADVQVIIDGLKPGVKWFYLDQSIDALSSISSILKDNYPVKALHLYTHGIPGTILLSYDEISAERLEQRSSYLRLWENYFLDGGDILLYGCEIGKGKSGEDFCNKLKQYTGLDVAASVNNTGSEAKGGDWILELNVGNIETTNSITFQAQNLYNNILGDVLVVDFDGGSTFNGSIISQFYNNLEGHTGTLSSSSILNLSNYELVYVIQPTRALTDAEIDNLLALLDRGGRIVFMGEHGGYTPSQNSNISDALIRLGAHFSIVNESTDGNWTACNRDMKGEGIMADVAIFEGVNTIDYNYMAPISMGGAAQVLITHRSEPSKTYMAMENIRNGSIIMYADQNIWDNVAETSCNDNAIFFENLIDLSCEDIANQQRALLTTIEAYSISGSDADCGGNIIDDKGSEIIQRGVCWSSITMSPTITDSKVTDTGAGDGLFAVKLSGLLLNTTYYARAFAVNGNGIAYGNMISFTTPAVQNTSPTAVSDSYSCEVNTSILGNVTNNDFDDDGDPVTVNMVTAPSYHSGIFTLGADGTFNYAHDGTSAPSDYFSYYLFDGVSKSATVGVGITLVVPQNAPVGSNESISFDSGEIYGFTTSDFTFTDADGHSFNGVKLLTVPDKGILRYNGLPVSAGGICNDVSKLTFDQNGDGTFVTPYTSFSFKVIDSSGEESDVSYIFTINVISSNVVSGITTQAVTNITTTTATGNGNITYLGIPNPTAHGVCWNTTGTPTTSDSKSTEGAVSATGAFTTNMTGLTAGTNYYVRAYATNTAGTAYGEEVSFTTAKNSQTITFGVLASKTYGDAPFSLTGTASSGLSVSYISSNPEVATVSGSTVTIIDVGSTSITASQSGDASYDAATDVVQTLTVDKKAVSISNFNDMTKLYFDGSFEIDAPTSTSVGAFTYTSSNMAVATVSGTKVTILSEGSTDITANQATDATHTSGSITATLTVNSVDVVTKHGENTTTNTNYVNGNGAVGGSNSLNIYGEVVATKSGDGLSALTAGTSAQQIKTDFPSATDGVYWIDVPGYGPKQTYCLMDDAYDGGGWMLALKATAGTTFNYGATYWTSTNTLNASDLTRNDADAKYDVMNGFLAKDMMALWPDIPNVGSESGSIDNLNQWSWLQNDFHNSGDKTTLISKFNEGQVAYYTSTNGSMTFSGYNATKFSNQQGFTFYGVNYTVNSGAKVRWGFAWNNETDQGTNDVSGGIGMDSTYGNYSAGDKINCCAINTGINRSARVEIFIR